MRRRTLVFLVICSLVVMGLLPNVAMAVGPSGSYASGIACLNLTQSDTTATITFYKADGGVATTVTNSALKPNSPWLLITTSINNLPPAFLGSAVVSSGANVACSVNTQNSGGTKRVGTADGVSSADTGTKVYATQVLNALGGFNSYVAVQNANANAADVKITYFNSAGASAATETVNIKGNASHVFYQDDGKLPAGFIGSATVESVDTTTKLAGAVALYSTQTAQLLSYNTFKDGANKVFLPRLSKNLSNVGYTSGWACQNLGPDAADMKMDISFLNQTDKTNVTVTLSKGGVAVGQSWLGYLGNATGTALDNVVQGYGNAIVTSTGGKIACTANEDNRTFGNLVGQGSTYSGVPDGKQSNNMFFPQIVALGADSFQGGFQIANTTNTATTCKYSFSNGDVIQNESLAASGSNSVFAPSKLINNKTNFNGSVKVECGQPIVGIYNLTVQGAAASGDPFATNNGINQ